jgi:hypothetical protein
MLTYNRILADKKASPSSTAMMASSAWKPCRAASLCRNYLRATMKKALKLYLPFMLNLYFMPWLICPTPTMTGGRYQNSSWKLYRNLLLNSPCIVSISNLSMWQESCVGAVPPRVSYSIHLSFDDLMLQVIFRNVIDLLEDDDCHTWKFSFRFVVGCNECANQCINPVTRAQNLLLPQWQ